MIFFNAKNFSSIIKERGLKISWVAEQSGISRNFLHLLIMGRRNPSKETLKSIAKTLKVSQKKLLLWG